MVDSRHRPRRGRRAADRGRRTATVWAAASVNYGFPAHTDEEYLGGGDPADEEGQGLGPAAAGHRHRRPLENGPRAAAWTRCAWPPIAPRPTSPSSTSRMARKLGLDTVGFLMMAHMVSPEKLVSQARLMESYGANCIYVHRLGRLHAARGRDGAHRRAVRAALKPETELGFHGHHNLAMGVANSLAAVEAGASRIDGVGRRPGRRRGQHADGGLRRRLRPHGHRDRRRSCSRIHGRGRGPAWCR